MQNGVFNLGMVTLPPPEERLFEGLVEKKILASSGRGQWEPKHAICTKTHFMLAHPSANESIHELHQVGAAKSSLLRS